MSGDAREKHLQWGVGIIALNSVSCLLGRRIRQSC